MGDTRKKNKQKTIRNRIIAFITVVVVVFVVIFVANLDYDYMEDQKKASEFDPSPEIEALVDKMYLTDKGKTILYASSPQLKDKVTFNGICGRDNDPDAYVAGCYYEINGEEYIDIYDSGKDATELQNALYDYANSKIVTLAHEMMHSVYARIPDSEKEWIEVELNKIYSNNSELRTELSIYPSTERYDELYARIPTEVYGIPSSLEKHYAQFFKDRQYIAKLYHDNKAQLDSILQEADKILEQIRRQETIIQNTHGYYARRGAIDEYNRLVEVYNAQVGVYRDTKDKMDSEK